MIKGRHLKTGLNLLFLAIVVLRPAITLGHSVADHCHRASQALECSYLKYQAGIDMLKLKVGWVAYEKDMEIRIGVQNPSTSSIKGDILFLHGFADRLDNHAPLFEEFNRAGFRVVSFDLPGHGESRGNKNDISRWSFTELTELAAFVEKSVVWNTGVKPRTLILAGWSTGGLLAVRMAQGLSEQYLSREISGLILYAPGVAVRVPWQLGEKRPDYLGGLVGRVTTQSLTHHPNPPHNGPIKPLSPVVKLRFGLDLTWNSFLARFHDLPSFMPMLVFVGGEAEDVYADSKGLKIWTANQRARGKSVYTIKCEHGRHELDNEMEPMGSIVRLASTNFAAAVADDEPILVGATTSCHF